MQPCVPAPRALPRTVHSFLRKVVSDRSFVSVLFLLERVSRLASQSDPHPNPRLWFVRPFWKYFDMFGQNATVTGRVSFSKELLASKRLPRGTLPPLFIVPLPQFRTSHLLSPQQLTPPYICYVARQDRPSMAPKCEPLCHFGDRQALPTKAPSAHQ